MSVKKFKFVSPGIFIDEIDNSQVPAIAPEVGPVIVGRSERGPAMRPVRIDSFSDFVSIFGNPIPGKGTPDAWRNGNKAGPTYGTYAAQAYLKNNGPITYVRLLGDQSDNKTAAAAATAGWSVGNGSGLAVGAVPNLAVSPGDNGGAFGLFVFQSGSTADVGEHSGTLAAIWYLSNGAVLLTGSDVEYAATGTCGLIGAIGTNKEFQVEIQNSAKTTVTKQVFNFNDASSNYIRKVFNTDPVLTNSTITPAETLTTYWLGETYDRNVTDRVVGNDTGEVYGMILPIQGDTIASEDGADFKQAFRAAQSGWVFSQDQSTSGSGYCPMDSTRVKKLFKFHSLGVGTGEWDQKNLKISIQNLKAPTNLDNPYPTFSVVIRRAQDSDNAVQVYERFSDCNLNPNSLNYLGRKVGDKYVTWVEADRAYQEYGTYNNQSQFVRVEMNSDVDEGVADSSYIPFGFFGPPKYTPATVLSGTAAGNGASLFVTGGFTVISSSVEAGRMGTVPQGKAFFSSSYSSTSGNEGETITLAFPSISMRSSSIDGNLSNPTDAYFGLTTTVNSSSTRFDASYQDVVRAKPADISGQTFDKGTSTVNVAFTMDDLFYASEANVMNYVSGSRAAETSCTDNTGSYTAVLDRGFDRFTMPLFGGVDGFRIDEKEPLRNTFFGDGATGNTNYAYYSVKKALDTVADPEVVEMNMLSMPGLTNASLTSHVLSICEERADALGIIDLADGYVPSTENTETAAERLGSVSQTIAALKARGINSSYGCTYYPWLQIRDNINGALLWVPPSVAAIGTLGSSAANSEIWFAPAGFNRGGLTEGSAGIPVLNVRQRLTSKNRDDLYEASINPIASFPSEGIVMFGQKTLQVTPSALDRINVRRLLIFLKKEISRMSATLLFDQNVQATWNRFLSQVLPFLASVKTRLGLMDYKVVLDDTTMTPDVIDRNIMYAKIFLKPAKAIEFIALDFVITDSGASFED